MIELNLEDHIEDYCHNQYRQTAVTNSPKSQWLNTTEVSMLTQSPAQMSPIIQLFRVALFQSGSFFWGFTSTLKASETSRDLNHTAKFPLTGQSRNGG